MSREVSPEAVVEELLTIQARIIVLEQLYTKFVNVTEPPEQLHIVEDTVGDMLRAERRKLADAIRTWIGVFS